MNMNISGRSGYAPACVSERKPCKVANFFEGCGSAASPYARAYVVSQAYSNCSSPECALRNGTYFNDLYMPYTVDSPACCGMEE